MDGRDFRLGGHGRVLTFEAMKITHHLRLGVIGCALAAVFVLHSPKDAEGAASRREPSWRTLFDGKSKEGWQQVGRGEFKLENGTLLTQGGPGMLWYAREKFSNCQLRVVFKLTANTNDSGVFIRIPERPKAAWDGANTGYEVQINNSGDPFHRTGCLDGITRAQMRVNANVNDWNTMIITLFGPRTRVHVNGVPVIDYMEEATAGHRNRLLEGERARRPEAGYIGLQNYNSAVVFREVSVRPLL